MSATTAAKKGILSKIAATAPINSGDTTAPNIFPVDVFTTDIQLFIKSAYENLGFPVDYTGTAVISAIGLSIGNSHELYVKSTWREKPIFDCAIVGPPGSSKTHSMDMAYNPINKYDRLAYMKYEADMKEYKRALQEYKSKPDKQNNPEPEKPICKRRTISDHTIEALHGAVKDNGAIGVYQDELKGWFGNFGRYNKGSEGEFWLTAFSGKDISIVRKNSEPIFVHSPYISVIGGIQVGILSELGADGRNKSGFTDRILFAWPDELPQNRWAENDVPDTILNNYNKIITTLIEQPISTDEYGKIKSTVVYLSADAKKVWEEWYNKNSEMETSASDDIIRGIYSKLKIYTLRFALILHVVKNVCNEGTNAQISAQVIKDAIRLTEYFRITAKRAAAAISKNDPLGTEAQDFQTLYKALPATFKTGEAIAIAKEQAYNIRTFERKLKNQQFFTKISQGNYKKAI